MNYSVRERKKRGNGRGFQPPLFKTMQMVTHSGIDTLISFEEGLPFGVVFLILGPFSLLQLLSLSLQ